MMKKILLFVVFGLITSAGFSQVKYKTKVEVGYLHFSYNPVQIDPGPNWKGYHLNGENGIDLNAIFGASLNKKIFLGAGLGYLNFDGINGYSLFGDFQYTPLKTKLSPFVDLRVGYNHIWNQYENGTGSASGELGLGAKYKLTDKINIYIQTGFLITQQSFLVPIRLGFEF